MGRIRSIKPEFPHSERVGRCSRDARLLFILTWTVADDEGRLRGSPQFLSSVLFPYDKDAAGKIEAWLGELLRAGLMQRYEVDGSTYLSIRNWKEHQRINRPTPARTPPPPEDSVSPHGALTEPSVRDWDPGLGLGSGIREGERKRKAAPSAQRPDDVSESVWKEWTAFRVVKRAPVTELVLQQTRKKAQEAGMTMEEALTYWVANGQTGFFPKSAANGSVNGKKDWNARFESDHHMTEEAKQKLRDEGWTVP